MVRLTPPEEENKKGAALVCHPCNGYRCCVAATHDARFPEVQRPLISEPITFSLSAFGPRVSATEPERTISMMP